MPTESNSNIKAQSLKDDARHYAVIFIVYLLSYWLILFNRGLFLDDPVTTSYFLSIDELSRIYAEIGFFLYWPAYAHDLAFKAGQGAGLFIERTVIFVSYLLSAFFLYNTLKSVKETDPRSRLLITILFAVFPINHSRIAISNLNYAISQAFFFLGLNLTALCVVRRSKAARIAALLAFFFSFSTNSIVFFYAIVLVFLYYRLQSGINLKTFRKFVITYSDFILLPVLFMFVKTFFFKATGLYAGYNSVGLRGLASGAVFSLKAYLLEVKLLARVFSFIDVYTIAGLLIGCVFFAVTLKRFNREEPRAGATDRKALYFFIFGLVALYLAVYPYAVVSKIFGINNWNDRHGLLVPLGSSFIIYYAMKIIARKRAVLFFALISALIAVFIAANNRALARFQMQDLKQRALLENFGKDEVIRNNTSFLFKDEAKDYNGYPDEPYRQYEWACLLKIAYKDETRNGFSSGFYSVEEPFYREFSIYNSKDAARYCIADYVDRKPQYEIIIEKSNSVRAEGLSGVELIFADIFGLSDVKDKINGLIVLKNVRLDGKLDKGR